MSQFLEFGMLEKLDGDSSGKYAVFEIYRCSALDFSVDISVVNHLTIWHPKPSGPSGMDTILSLGRLA